MDALKWLMDNQVALLVAAYAVLNVLNAVLSVVPGDQGEGKGGWLSKVRSVLDRVSLLTAKGDPVSVKMPLTKSKK